MSDSIHVSEVRLVRASVADEQRGLIGWVSLKIGQLLLDGIAVRRTRDGRLVLSFPERRDLDGRRHPIIRPSDDEARRALEREILFAIGLGEGGTA